jgi:FkbM family methyltransferase
MCASEHPLYMFYLKYLFKPPKDSLQELIDKYSKAIPGLTVVQVGANDGFNHDPLVKFIKRDKWKGVLLEPQTNVYDRYLSKLHKNNFSIHVLNKALYWKDEERLLFKISFSNARWASGLSTFNKASLLESIESGHVARCAAKEGISLPESLHDYIATTTISCISTETLIKQFDLHHIDLLQIDAEGYDVEIIKMMNISETKPGMIVFEHTHLTSEDLDYCFRLFDMNDYKIIKTKSDTAVIRSHLYASIL